MVIKSEFIYWLVSRLFGGLIGLSLMLSPVLVGCAGGEIARVDESAECTIYPDYKGTTIPCNISPLCFSAVDSLGEPLSGDFALRIEGASGKLWVRADGADFVIPPDGWRILTSAAAEEKGKLTFTVARNVNGEWVGYKPFEVYVMPDSIDEYITYRLIPPGYVGWYKMGIYQHCLSDARQSVIFENTHTQGNCVNCHTVGSHRPDRTLMHIRVAFAGTYLYREGRIERLDAKTDSTISAFVYPSWHPDGRHIAFSNNSTAQTFHTADPNRIEVFDYASDVIVYDAESRRIAYSPLLKNANEMQTFPCFSPDGRWLYFCTAPLVEDVELNYKRARYSLCRIAFNSEDMTFGNNVDTLYNARTSGRSVSFPRISPDGRWLVCTISDYGNFSIWHGDADLYMADLAAFDNTSDCEDGVHAQRQCEFRPLRLANSPNTESYHTWSSNGRWLVFSSRRDDGLYTRPYFTYIDEWGRERKPFMLPQKRPREHYLRLDMSYNIPEFMTGPAQVSMRDYLRATEGDALKVGLKLPQ